MAVVRKLRVGIVEDHPIVTEALEKRLGDAGMLVIGANASVEDVDLSLLPDVVVCDLNLTEGRLQAGKAVSFLVERGVRVLAMSGMAVRAEVLEAIASGASGFVEKTATPGQFVDAVNEVSAGGLFASARLADYLLDDMVRKPLRRDEIGWAERALLYALATGESLDDYADEHNVGAGAARQQLKRVFDAARRRRRLYRPSPRESELLVLLGCEGLGHKAAAARMGVKASVIPDFLKGIKAKYLATHPEADESVAPKTVAQLWARELGLC